MKFCGLVALSCAMHSLGTTAFLIPSSKVQPSVELDSSRVRDYDSRHSVGEQWWERNDSPMRRYNSARSYGSGSQWWEGSGTASSLQWNEGRTSWEDPYTSRTRPYGGSRGTWWENRRGRSTVQGGSRGTWTDPYYNSEKSHVSMETDGRPLSADLELWQGPGNTPQKVRVYSEDGRLRPFNAMVSTPNKGAGGNTMSIRNTGPLAFPMSARVDSAERSSLSSVGPSRRNGLSRMGSSQRGGGMSYGGRTSVYGGTTVHGGALRTWSFDPSVASVEVTIHSEGLPVMAVIELWQGPGSVKQIAEVYTEDGDNSPFSTIIDTPGFGTGNTIAIRNAGPMAYPLIASVEPSRTSSTGYDGYDGYSRYGGYNGYRGYGGNDNWWESGSRGSGGYGGYGSYGRHGSYNGYGSYDGYGSHGRSRRYRGDGGYDGW